MCFDTFWRMDQNTSVFRPDNCQILKIFRLQLYKKTERSEEIMHFNETTSNVAEFHLLPTQINELTVHYTTILKAAV